ncbi:hypothetical protein DMH18_11915 [Streptomyces sp. WAC 06783]|uniref:hypothetical protein n=1 Tax=Streptomyces sp. WAC 06783 TaxID=2203211 RepID=UPI000F73948A|nr:hypothetical protein [Streptomyces sp. WAC 06783]RSO10840.1 hypothetical protein DMH18_11915 [Streptomyces sp. WAC 06783]
MPLLAALWPLAMLGLVIALGRYEEALLRPRRPRRPPSAEPQAAVARGRQYRRPGPYGRAASIDRYRHAASPGRLPAHPLVFKGGAPQRIPRRHGHQPPS